MYKKGRFCIENRNILCYLAVVTEIYDKATIKNTKVRFPQTFTENYKNSETLVVSPDNIEEFLIDY